MTPGIEGKRTDQGPLEISRDDFRENELEGKGEKDQR